ncbi:hypothetical protein [Nocardia mangyaensis]|uniref:hypothetical protein n=1 Tax=Nocardia mangyaensis TaxID=2213200 RepID=UPI002676E6A2|nr:hypothetical protein [Nocardia mangyaensis]MDO3647684.1 hypothetical protein [Nocardia mangyaensis]
MTKRRTAGQKLVSAVEADLKDLGLEPDSRDSALLDTVQRLADRMEQLQSMVDEDGERTVSQTGMVRLHPGIAEYRQHAVALSAVLSKLSFDVEGKDPVKQRAAQSRWGVYDKRGA